MAVTSTPVLPQAINMDIGRILPGDTTSLKTVFTAGANGSLIQSLGLSSTDTANRTILFYITRSATNYPLCTITAPLTSGYAAGVPAVDVLRHANLPWLQYDMAGNRQLRLKSGDTLQFKSSATITAATEIVAFADGEDL